MKLTGEDPNTGRKTYPSATLSTTNPTLTDPRSNPCLRCEGPAANRLSHGMALYQNYTKEKTVYEYVFAILYLCD
jgi:hypothetical protein